MNACLKNSKEIQRIKTENDSDDDWVWDFDLDKVIIHLGIRYNSFYILDNHRFIDMTLWPVSCGKSCSPSSYIVMGEIQIANGREYTPPNTARTVRYDLGLYNRNL